MWTKWHEDGGGIWLDEGIACRESVCGRTEQLVPVESYWWNTLDGDGMVMRCDRMIGHYNPLAEKGV